MPRSTVVWVGDSRDATDLRGRPSTQVTTLAPAGLGRATLLRNSPCVVVLGREALRMLAPCDVRTATKGLRVAVLAVADARFSGGRRQPAVSHGDAERQIDVECIVEWARSFAVEFVAAERLAARIAILQASGIRRTVDPAAWLPDTPPATRMPSVSRMR